ncbi:hypothetical protein [Prochlorococcus sp. MIT 1223]|uniref:hypothetical protein n=1 Tax=Prochlorococcus sp. MIT 1223 TaxID=3096217 RepID=UPI002A75E165|nr:hypothetical protein [Prochlorococcus sp. MIT 1223]
MTGKRDVYYQKYFPDGKGIKASEEHMLNIWLDDDAVTRDDLLKAGLVEGKDEDDDECDFYLDDEDLLCVPPLAVPMNGDVGIEQEDLDEGLPGIEVLPDDWEEGVPELIGFKPEWVDGVSMDG